MIGFNAETFDAQLKKSMADIVEKHRPAIEAAVNNYAEALRARRAEIEAMPFYKRPIERAKDKFFDGVFTLRLKLSSLQRWCEETSARLEAEAQVDEMKRALQSLEKR